MFSIFITITTTSAQWAKISNQSVGTSGKIHSHNSVIFLYGPTNNFSVYRSDNNGQTWSENIANKFPYDVYYMYNYKNEIFAVTTTLGKNIWRFYSSKDEGLTWSEKSNIENVTGNGAILSMTSDGDKLIAVSNRKSFYISLDDGLTWKENIINTQVSGNIIYFASSGNNLVAVFAGVGAVVSTDGGQSWNVNNPTAPASVINYVINYNGSIYGTTQSGVSKFNTKTKTWDDFSKGLPDPSSFQFAKILYPFGNSLYFGSVGFLDSKPQFFYLKDGGTEWNKLTTDGLTTISLTISSTSFAANNQNLFLYDYDNKTKEATLYKLSNYTSVDSKYEQTSLIDLDQNHPNPFNNQTTITLSIPNSDFVTLKVYDLLGNDIATIVNENLSAGSYSYDFKANNINNGIYFYKLKVGPSVKTKIMIINK